MRKGRRSKHPNPLPDIDEHATLLAIDEIYRQKEWGPSDIRRSLNDFFGRKNYNNITAKELENADFGISDSSVSRFIRKEIKLNGFNLWAIFLFVKEDYGKILSDKQIGEQLNRKETLVKALRRALGYTNDVNLDNIRSMQGTYKLYRPAFFDTNNHILVHSFKIGEDIGNEASFFDCELSGVFIDNNGVERENRFVGKVAPHGKNVMAILTSPTPRKSNVVLHFDFLDSDTSENVIKALNGIALTAVGDVRASAWPIYALRLSNDDKKDFQPSIIPAHQYSTLPKSVQEALARGAVHWNEAHFPKPYGEPTP